MKNNGYSNEKVAGTRSMVNQLKGTVVWNECQPLGKEKELHLALKEDVWNLQALIRMFKKAHNDGQ